MVFALEKLRMGVVFYPAPCNFAAYLIYDVGFLFLAFGFALPEEKYCWKNSIMPKSSFNLAE